jgi:diacylglycerol kinase family enzyme
VTAVLIVNPWASRVTPARTDAVARALGDVVVDRTEGPGHATELARDACARGAEAVFVFSGDGGFNEAVNGADAVTPFGFVPGGGTSVVPRSLGLPRDPVRAAERLAARRTLRISLGRVNGRRFLFGSGIGLDAELIRRMDALGRSRHGRRPGDLRFVWTAARAVAERRARFEPALELAGLGRAAFALVANGDVYTYAGPRALRLAPLARYELGFDVVAPKSVRPGTLPRLLLYIARGRGQESAENILYAHDRDRLEAACDEPLPLQADGEDLGDVREAVFEAERDALVVLA